MRAIVCSGAKSRPAPSEVEGDLFHHLGEATSAASEGTTAPASTSRRRVQGALSASLRVHPRPAVRPAVRLAISAALTLVLAAPLAAQGARPVDARLARLDAGTGAQVGRLVDSARAAGLPVEPLVDKALEGASKRAPGARIVDAVRSLARGLGDARGALGRGAGEEEVIAGASALRGGVTTATLAELRSARPREPLTIALAVLSDLVARGVPADTAAAAVLALARGGARDDDFVALRRDVEKDIGAGAPAASAASVRARGMIPGLARGVAGGRASNVPQGARGMGPPADRGKPQKPKP